MNPITAWIRKQSFWDLLAWIAYVFFIVYFFLLVTGRLHSPIALNAFGIASLAYFMGSKFQKLDNVAQKLDNAAQKL